MKDIEGGMFGDKEYFKPLVDSISNMKVGNDWFLVANDFAGYLDAQEEVDKVRHSGWWSEGAGRPLRWQQPCWGGHLGGAISRCGVAHAG